MKHLLLCRHAKSSWKDGTLPDRERPLNKRGKQDGPEMGRRLRQRGAVPDLIVSSPARRALATARLLAGECGIPAKKILVIDGMYDSYPAKLLQLIQGFDDRHDTVLMVGHNPELTILVNILANPDIENVPTSGIVALDFACDRWGEVAEQSGSLVFFDYPRKEKE